MIGETLDLRVDLRLLRWDTGRDEVNLMIAINAHYDGKVIVPDEPLELPLNQALIVRIEPAPADGASTVESALTWFSQNAVDAPALPTDLSDRHDHYLYGAGKRNA